MQFKNIRFMDSAININIDTDNFYLLKNVYDLFSTHFDFVEEPQTNAIADISFYKIDSFSESGFKLGGREYKEIIMRTSSMPRFRLGSKHYSFGELDVYDCNDSGTIMIFNNKKKKIDIYASEHSDIQIIELIRDLIIKDQEHKGTMILHSAAAAKNGRAVVIAGSKGAGKSTTLLELVLRHGYEMLSGDKLFLKLDDSGSVIVNGWPDYPHLGVGTILKHESLRAIAEKYYCDSLEEMSTSSKILMNPEIFAEESGICFAREHYKLEKIIFPQFTDIAERSFKRLEEPNVEDIIELLEFKWDYPQARWHSLIVPDYASREQNVEKLRKAIIDCDYYSFTGKLKFEDLDLEELEK